MRGGSGSATFGGAIGERKRGLPVVLNVYDLAPSNEALYPLGLGAYHSGVEVAGTEYTFSAAGVVEMAPRSAQAPFREALPLGEFMGGHAELRAAVADMREEFPEGSYDVLRKNCNCFADAFCRRLLRRGIPSYVNRLAYWGAAVGRATGGCFSLGPVSGEGEGGGEGESAAGGSFAGEGRALAGASDSSSSAGAALPSDADERRELQRRAALARMSS